MIPVFFSLDLLLFIRSGEVVEDMVSNGGDGDDNCCGRFRMRLKRGCNRERVYMTAIEMQRNKAGAMSKFLLEVTCDHCEI